MQWNDTDANSLVKSPLSQRTEVPCLFRGYRRSAAKPKNEKGGAREALRSSGQTYGMVAERNRLVYLFIILSTRHSNDRG